MHSIKITYLLFFFTLLVFCPFEQESGNNKLDFGTYEHQNNKDSLMLSLSLHEDFTFDYEYSITYTNSFLKGHWRIDKDTLILYDTVYDALGLHRLYYDSVSFVKKQDFILINLKDEYDNPLSDIEVSINDQRFIKTDIDGNAKFYSEFLNKGKDDSPKLEIIFRTNTWRNEFVFADASASNTFFLKKRLDPNSGSSIFNLKWFFKDDVIYANQSMTILKDTIMELKKIN